MIGALSLRLYFFLILLFPVFCTAQVRLYVTVQPFPARICLGEPLEYRVVLENTGETPDLATPVFTHFSMIGNPVRESGVKTVRNREVPFTSWTYTLRPVKTGRYQFAPSYVTLEGRRYETQPVQVLVNDCMAPAQKPLPEIPGMLSRENWVYDDEPLEPRAREGVSFQLELNKRSCYVGEPVMAHYFLLSRVICESSLTRQPSFTGFSVTDLPLPDPTMPASRTFRGSSFNQYSVRKAQLYPLQPGSFEVESAELDNRIRFLRASYVQKNPADDWMRTEMLPPEAFRETRISLRNEPLVITVKPLPESGKPAFFTGAVGEMTLQASLLNERFALNSTGMYRIRISGRGNLHLLTPPDIRWPDGLEGFEPKTELVVDRTSIPVSGYLEFQYPFTVKDTGMHALPPFSFAYFDPRQEKYISLITEPLRFSTGPPDARIQPVTGRAKASPGFATHFFSHRWWVVLVIAVIMLSGLLIWVWRDAREEAQNKKNLIAGHEEEKPAEAPGLSNPSVRNAVRSEAEEALASGDIQQYFTKSLLFLRLCLGDQSNADEIRLLIRQIEDRLYNPLPDEAADRSLMVAIERFRAANP